MKYKEKFLDTGDTKTTAIINRESDWEGPGCHLVNWATSCACNEENHRKRVVWTSDGEETKFAYMMHHKFREAETERSQDRSEL